MQGIKILFLVIVMAGTLFAGSDDPYVLEQPKKASEVAKQWANFSDEKIKELVKQALDKPGSLNAKESSVHAAIVRITSSPFLKAIAQKEKEEAAYEEEVKKWNQKNDEWLKKIEEHPETNVPQPEFPLSPSNDSDQLVWCTCVNKVDRLSYVIILVRDVLKAYPDFNKKLVYTSLGSGDLLQDTFIVEELLYVGFNNILINTIEERYKDENLPVLVAFRKHILSLQSEFKKNGRSVVAHVNPYRSVGVYVNSRPRNEKIDVLSMVDVGSTFSEETAWNKYVNQIEITVVSQQADAVQQKYYIMLSPNRENYGYMTPYTEEKSELHKFVHDIIVQNIKSVDSVKAILKPIAEQEYVGGELSKQGDIESWTEHSLQFKPAVMEYWSLKQLSLQIAYGSNAIYAFGTLCKYTDDHAVVRYFDWGPQARAGDEVPKEGDDNGKNSSKHEDTMILYSVDPKTFNADALIIEQFVAEGLKPISSKIKQQDEKVGFVLSKVMQGEIAQQSLKNKREIEALLDSFNVAVVSNDVQAAITIAFDTDPILWSRMPTLSEEITTFIFDKYGIDSEEDGQKIRTLPQSSSGG